MHLRDFIHLLHCPDCSGVLKTDTNSAECTVCQKKFTARKSKITFETLSKKQITDSLDRIKLVFKKYPPLYQFLVRTISPLYDDGTVSRFIAEHVHQKNGIAFNFGSGNTSMSPQMLNLDIIAYPRVNIVCSAEHSPINSNCADVIFSEGLLEHVPDPKAVISEMFRILKPGGILYIVMPFIQGFHASPYDYTRLTRQGVRELLKGFQIEYVECSGGPTSAFLWIFQEYVALMLSFGNRTLHSLIYITLMLLTFPLKYLDYFMLKNPLSEHISTRFICCAKKPL